MSGGINNLMQKLADYLLAELKTYAKNNQVKQFHQDGGVAEFTAPLFVLSKWIKVEFILIEQIPTKMNIDPQTMKHGCFG